MCLNEAWIYFYSLFVSSAVHQPACCYTLVAECTQVLLAIHTNIVTFADLRYNDWLIDINRGISRRITSIWPIPVAARSKAARLLGSNPTSDIDVCLLRVLCVVQIDVSASR